MNIFTKYKTEQLLSICKTNKYTYQKYLTTCHNVVLLIFTLLYCKLAL